MNLQPGFFGEVTIILRLLSPVNASEADLKPSPLGTEVLREGKMFGHYKHRLQVEHHLTV